MHLLLVGGDQSSAVISLVSHMLSMRSKVESSQTLRAAKGFKMVEVLLSETENRIEYIDDHHSQVAGGQQNRIAGGGWHW